MKVITPTAETIELGITETTPTIGINDFSRRVTDEFGVTTVVKRAFARRMSVRCALPTADVDAITRVFETLRATPAQWVADDRFSWLNIQGFYKDFEPGISSGAVSFYTLTVEGLAQYDEVADAGGDPAPTGASTLMLLQPIEITPARLVTSSVVENDHPIWSNATAYATGARVIKLATHRVYESVADANVGNDPAGASGLWIDIGPTKRWAMFDQALGTITSAADSIVVTVDAGAADALALLDVVGATARVQTTGYDRTIAIGDGPVTFLDLPGAAANIIVTINGPDTVSVGTLLVGPLATLGITGDEPTAGITDFSKKEIDDFGEVTVVPRSWAKRMSTRALIRTDAIDLVANRIATVRALPSLWIAADGTDSLTVYGFFKDFSIEVGENVSTLSLSIEGLSEAAPLSPGLPPPNWTDIVNNDPVNHPKPDDGATVGAPAGTPVGNRLAETLTAQVDGTTQAVADLIEIYGDTVAAGAAAALAEQAKDDAIAAANASEGYAQTSETKRDEASGFASAAEASAVTAAGSSDSAETSATAAESSAAAADASEASAATSAGLSATYRDDAQTQAGVATAGAATATAQASAASTSAGLSATYRDQSQGFRDTAQTQAGVATTQAATATAAAATATSQASLSATYSNDARLNAAMIIPSDFVRDGQYYFLGYDGTPAARSLNPLVASSEVSFVDVTGVGRVIQIASNGAQDISNIGVLQVRPGRTYRSILQFRTLAGTRPITHYMITLNSIYSFAAMAGGNLSPTATTTWQTSTISLTGDALLANNITYLRTLARTSVDPNAVQWRMILIEDASEEFNAASQATIAASQATLATASAAAAQSSMVLAASIGGNFINKNAGFDDYPSASVGALPTSYVPWDGGTFYRVPDNLGGYSIRCPAAAGVSLGFSFQQHGSINLVNPSNYYVLEAEVTLNSGSFSGSGFYMVIVNSGGAEVETGLRIWFDLDKDSTGAVAGAGVAGKTYTFTKLIKVNAPTAYSYILYLLTHWAGFGSIAAANDITWHRAGVRPATLAEIRDQTVLSPMEATVSTHSSAIATLNGASATWETIVAAGGGNPAIVRLKAGLGGSAIDLAASRLSIYNPSNTGEFYEVARFADGKAQLNDALIRNLLVAPTEDSEVYFPVQLKPRIYMAAHGQVIQYDGGKSLGANPERISADTGGIAFGAGEALDIRAVSISPTQFTVRAVKITPTAPANQATGAGTNVGGTPGWQVHKPTAADAYNGYYKYNFTVSLVCTNVRYNEFKEKWNNTYEGSVGIYVNTGAGHVLIDSPTISVLSQTSSPATLGSTQSYSKEYTLQYSNPIGLHGGYEFGLASGTGATVTAFAGVSYTTQTPGTETALTQMIPFYVYPPVA